MNFNKLLFTSFLLFSCLGVFAQQQFTEVAAMKGLNLDGKKDGGFVFADFNNDGYEDLMVNTMEDDANYRSRLYFNQGPPSYNFVDVTATHAAGLAKGGKPGRSYMGRCGVAGDVNNDGYIDFVRNTATRLEVYLNKGPNPADGDVPWSFGVGVGATGQDADFVLWSDNINNTNPLNGIPNGMNTEGIGLFDYDNDGDYDLMIENHNYGVDIYANQTIPTGNFGFVHVTPGTGVVKGLPQTAVDGDYSTVTDINNDGFVDVLARKRNANDFYLNNGDGTFTEVSTGQHAFDQQACNHNKGAVSMYDFDNDGDFDLFWTDNGENQIWLQQGVGSGIFVPTGEPWASAGVSYATPNDCQGYYTGIDGLSAGDVNNDGKIDLFLGDGQDSSFLLINTAAIYSNFSEIFLILAAWKRQTLESLQAQSVTSFVNVR